MNRELPSPSHSLWQEVKAAIARRIAGRQVEGVDNEHALENSRLKAELIESRGRIRALLEEHEQALEELKDLEARGRASSETFRKANDDLKTSNAELEISNRDLEADNRGLSTEIEGLRVRNLELNQRNEKAGQALTEREESLLLLREGMRHKNEFLATLAHELRTPLAALSSALGILRQTEGSLPRRQDAHRIADRQLKNQIRLVDDLLDVSRIERGIVALSIAEVDFCEITRAAVDSLRTSFDERNHHVTLALPAESLCVSADANRLEQVIANLLVNACKYTPNGGRIVVSMRREAGHAVLEVMDSGIGMSPDLLPKVFDLFVQAECSLDRANGGLGIGLALVRKLVRLHGGSIEAHSEGLNQGSTFRVRLPVTHAA